MTTQPELPGMPPQPTPREACEDAARENLEAFVDDLLAEAVAGYLMRIVDVLASELPDVPSATRLKIAGRIASMEPF